MTNWRGLLPADVAARLLGRWAEPHRRYHSTTHLVAGLHALEILGSTRIERIAFWFHDAHHRNDTPNDEIASAALAGHLLRGHLVPDEVQEVQRLVLLTTRHTPAPGDLAGARLCDADLAGLAAPWELYACNAEGIRAEFAHLDDRAWRSGRAAFLRRFLAREQIYHSDLGVRRWEAVARTNLQRELWSLSKR